MNVYYRFYFSDFLDGIRRNLNEDTPKDAVEQLICMIIKQDSMEMYQQIKGKIPKWLQYHISEVLTDKEVLDNTEQEILDNNTLKVYDYTDFLLYLVTIDVKFEYFMDYASCYGTADPVSARTYYSLLERAVTNAVQKEFSSFNVNKTSLEELIDNIKNILAILALMEQNTFYINTVVRVIHILKYIRSLLITLSRYKNTRVL